MLCNYQIYFDQLRCFQEILVLEFHGLNSALNSTVKAFLIAIPEYDLQFSDKWHFDLSNDVCKLGTLNSSNNALFGV